MPTNRTEPRSRKVPAVLPLLHDRVSPRAWGGGASPGNHDRLATSVATADSRRLAPSRNHFSGPVSHGLHAMRLRILRGGKGCAKSWDLQVALSLLSIGLVVALAAMGGG